MEVRVNPARSTGAEVIRVESVSPERAGVRLGDVIVQWDLPRITSPAAVDCAAGAERAGALRIIRYGREVTANVTPGVVRSGTRPQPRAATADGPARAGLQVTQRGGRVVIAAVQQYSAAARAGVRPGQMIVSANGQEIGTAAQLSQIVGNARSSALSLVVDDP